MTLLDSSAVSDPAEVRFLYVRTFGCQMNEYDSLRVQRLLAPHGYRPTDDPAMADLVFLNTCSVREKAEQKVLSFLGRMRRLKALNPGLKIVVAGCVAQQLGSALLDRFDTLDLVLGTRGIPSIGELVERIQRTRERLAFLPEVETPPPASFFEPETPVKSTVAAPVTIMQGCNNFCTYCIVPHVRGRERSRSSAEIIREIRGLLTGGTREVLLLGQNVNSYGRGLDEKITFADLLRRIGEETNVERIRFTTSHPKDLTDDLIQLFGRLPSLCRYLHLPFQAGSDTVLKRMNRGYTAAFYRELIQKLRDVCPDVGLSSDAMVGFPGETEDDFQLTLQLIQHVQFDNLFSFRYSDRPFAPSSHFSGKVDDPTKARRLMELQSLQAEISGCKYAAEVGKVHDVLVEGESKLSDGQMTGRTHQNRIVNFDGPLKCLGHVVHVRITTAHTHSLRGELLHD